MYHSSENIHIARKHLEVLLNFSLSLQCAKVSHNQKVYLHLPTYNNPLFIYIRACQYNNVPL